MPDDEFKKVSVGKEFTVCPNCGYERGFHSVFHKIRASKDLRWRLICPSCGAKYDLGLRAKRS